MGGRYAEHAELYGSLFFVLISLILTALNVVKGYWLMTAMTTVLAVGFLIAALLAFRSKRAGSRVLMAVLCGIIFSCFAIIGGNNGFAILWILLVPIISSFLVGLRVGFCLNLYFQIFLIVLFYTPLSTLVADYYTPTFIMRFPLLYFASFGAITLLMCQRQDLFKEIHRQAYHDELTNLFNRRYYNELHDKFEASTDLADVTVFSFDLNGLKQANDTLGHEAGDELIGGAAQIISECFDAGSCCRTGGDEFTVIFKGDIDPSASIARVKEKAAGWHGELVDTQSFSVGYASGAAHPGASFEELSRIAEQGMYADKADYYRASGHERRRSDR